VERFNVMILQGLKPRIFDRLKPYARKWVKELPSVLWALHTTPSRAWATHHSHWSTGLRHCYLVRWSTNLSVYSSSTNSSWMTPESMI
jgi:hypothetical protein